jgi:hypothetical protein
MIRTSEITTDSQAEQFIREQMNMRLELIKNPKFVKECITYVKSLGMGASEWNDNMFAILMLLANEAVGTFYKNEVLEEPTHN